MEIWTLISIASKYENIVFPNLYKLIADYLERNPDKIKKYASDKIKIEKLLYFLRKQEIKTQEDLLNETIFYVEELYAWVFRWA